ncbi:MAG TPA: glycosyltransferase family 4 protein [Lacunisphaera sp.]|nr:glycosyltransferase family 4 protein [Lacunisphaera sp.]
MKITIVCGFLLPVPPVAGGAMEKMWWRLARLYARRGHQVTLISRRWPGWANEETVDGVRLLRLPGANHRRQLWKNLLLDALWGWRVLSALPAGDILITNTVALPVFVRTLRPAAGRLVVNLNRFPKGQVRWYGRAARIQAASGIIAETAKQQAPKLASIIRVVPNPVDCSAFKAAPAGHPTGGPVTIGYMGRINPEKGLLTLAKAAALLAEKPGLPPWRIVLRGPTDVPRGGGGEAFVAQLRAAAPALWQDGRLSLADPLYDAGALAAAYRSLDVFCYPTEAAEGEAHPVAVLEAMAAGCPIVATNLPCFADQLRTGENALLVPPHDAAALANAFDRLLRDPALRTTLATRASAVIWALDDEAVATQHLADYESLLHDARS